MKKYSFLTLVAGLSVATLTLSGFLAAKNDQVRHVVIFKYKSGATEAEIAQVTKAFGEMKKSIPGIVSFEHGINDSPENKHQGFTHVYMVTFKNAAARDTYLPHPEHKKFGQLLGTLDILEDVFVVDYSPTIKL